MTIIKVVACIVLLSAVFSGKAIGEVNYKVQFNKLSKQISDKSYVALGEQSHGAGNVFDFKAQFVQYMHQKHNFDVFIIESGLFDIDMLYRDYLLSGKSIEKNAPGNIFYMYANSAEMSPLFKYIEKTQHTNRPLILAGFDSQHTGSLSNQYLLNDLSKELPGFTNEFTETQWKKLRQEFELVLKVKSLKPNDTKLKQFQKNYNALKVHANNIKNRRSFWLRIIAGLKAQTYRQWQIEDLRSKEIGNNLVWIANQYPGKKVLIWGHTFHVEKNLVHETENAGKVMLKEFGDDYFVSHITGSSGTYVDFIDMKTKLVKESETDSFEVKISKHKCTVCVVNLHTLEQPEQIDDILYFNYTNSVPFMKNKHKWDNVVYFKEITPSKKK